LTDTQVGAPYLGSDRESLDDQIGTLTSTEIQAFTTTQPRLTATQFGGLTTTELGLFATAQISALSTTRFRG